MVTREYAKMIEKSFASVSLDRGRHYCRLERAKFCTVKPRHTANSAYRQEKAFVPIGCI